MDFVVARTAQRHQVSASMSPAFGYRQHMMHLVHRGELALFQTHLTQRVLTNIAVTDTLPRSAVFFVDIRGTLILVILPPHLFSMLFAVLPVTQVRTAGIGTRTPWFLWHSHISFRAKEKALRLLHHKALNYSVSLIIVYHFWQVDIKGQRRTFRAFFRFLPDFWGDLHGRAPCRASGEWCGSRHSARSRFCPMCSCGCSGIVIPFAH